MIFVQNYEWSERIFRINIGTYSNELFYLYALIRYTNSKLMLVISSKEFRDNQRKYFDLVDQNEQVIVQRGKEKAYVLVPITEKDRFFMDPEVVADVQEGIEDYKAGRVIKVKEADLDQLLGL